MDIFLLRTAGESKLKKYFSEEETQSLRFFADGKNRTSTMFDFAARCYDGDAPTIPHPLGQAEARCAHSTSLKNIYNTLHFVTSGGDDFIIVQRVTFMDALIFPSRGVAIILRSIKKEDLAGVLGSLASFFHGAPLRSSEGMLAGESLRMRMRARLWPEGAVSGGRFSEISLSRWGRWAGRQVKASRMAV